MRNQSKYDNLFVIIDLFNGQKSKSIDSEKVMHSIEEFIKNIDERTRKRLLLLFKLILKEEINDG